MTNQQDSASWRVTGITETTDFDAVKGPRPARRIDFETISGHQGHVVIPDSEFSPDNARTRVHDMALKITEVGLMEGPHIFMPGELEHS